VVSADEHIAVQSLEVFDRLLPILHVHRHVSEVDQDVLGGHHLVVPVEQRRVHLADATERPVAVLDDVRVTEVVIGDDVPTHTRGVSGSLKTSWVARRFV